MSISSEKLAQAKRLATIVYALQTAGVFILITLPIGAVISHLQRPKVSGTWLESHFLWQIATFWISLGWGALGAAFHSSNPMIGEMILAGDLMWIVYRIVPGWTRLSGGKPVGAAAVEAASRD